jgi:hypothetical protein
MLHDFCPGPLEQPIKRLAFAGALIVPVANRLAAYGLLDQYLRCIDVDPNSTDFLYRINRGLPNSRVVGDVAINRLVTWGAVMFTLQGQLITPGVPGTPRRSPVEAHGVLLDLDINTAAERQLPLPQEQLGALFTELTDVAHSIARDGDARP